MDEADGTSAGGELLEDDLFWVEAAPFPPSLAQQLDALAAEIGVVDFDAPITDSVALGKRKCIEEDK